MPQHSKLVQSSYARSGRLVGLLAAALCASCTDSDPTTETPDACIGSCGASAPPDAGLGLPTPDGQVVLPPAPATNLPCDVQAVLGKHCGSCHVPGGPAPMALGKVADFTAKSPTLEATSVASSVRTRIHSSDTKDMMPPAGYERPSAEQLATLDAWIARGTPAASETCGTPTAPDAGVAVTPDNLECFKFLAHDPSSKDVKFNVGLALDVYVNMTFVPPWPETRYAVSVKPIIDNAKVLHHWLLFRNATPGADGLVAPAVGAHPDGELITAWAPGGDGLDLTNVPDVGYEMPGGAGTSYTVEFHYNSGDPTATDASGVEVCMYKKKPTNTASVSWLGKDNLGLPEPVWTATCDPISDEPIRILSVMPHMHQDGVHMTAIINRANGTKETLHDEDFSFEYQKSYPKDVTLNAGDSITTTCTFRRPTAFGKSTDAEMCYLFTYAYPSGALTQLDPWGYFAHGGNACLQ